MVGGRTSAESNDRGRNSPARQRWVGRRRCADDGPIRVITGGGRSLTSVAGQERSRREAPDKRLPWLEAVAPAVGLLRCACVRRAKGRWTDADAESDAAADNDTETGLRVPVVGRMPVPVPVPVPRKDRAGAVKRREEEPALTATLPWSRRRMLERGRPDERGLASRRSR